MTSLLGISTDAKTVKGEPHGYLTGILYLAPHTSGGGGTLCPNASPGCIASCLNTAGRGGVFPSVQVARQRKTRHLRNDRAGFMAALSADVARLTRKAARAGLRPVVRLNGTSDLPWESLGIMGAHPDVQFYDYTKSPRRMRRYLDGALPANYHLTFSRSECNDADAVALLARGATVAVVFRVSRGAPLPATWRGYPVLDGDLTDLRFADGTRGAVVGLRAKGRAKNDASGFVVAA